MITPAMVDRFLEGVRGQALREGTRYAREASVGDLVGSGEGVSTVVRGGTGDFETALWVEDSALEHRCSCPSWRNPCKHQVAAALVLRQCLAKMPGFLDKLRPLNDASRDHMVPDPWRARRQAVEERRLAARREELRVSLDVAPILRVASPSGFAYRVHLRGDAEGASGHAGPRRRGGKGTRGASVGRTPYSGGEGRGARWTTAGKASRRRQAVGSGDLGTAGSRPGVCGA